jgi:hypothetical protein
MAFKMKNKAVMKMAKMAGDSRTAMKMKNESAMKMKKQSAMKMKDPMDMKKNPMMMKKGSAMDMKKEPMKMKKNSAMKKKTDDDDKFMTEEELDNFYKNQPEGETKTYPANHPRSKRLKKIKDMYNAGKISVEQLNQLNNQVLTDPKYSSPKTMKKGAMKMAKKSPMKKDKKSIKNIDMTGPARARREKARLKKEEKIKKLKLRSL